MLQKGLDGKELPVIVMISYAPPQAVNLLVREKASSMAMPCREAMAFSCRVHPPDAVDSLPARRTNPCPAAPLDHGRPTGTAQCGFQ